MRVQLNPFVLFRSWLTARRRRRWAALKAQRRTARARARAYKNLIDHACAGDSAAFRLLTWHMLTNGPLDPVLNRWEVVKSIRRERTEAPHA